MRKRDILELHENGTIQARKGVGGAKTHKKKKNKERNWQKWVKPEMNRDGLPRTDLDGRSLSLPESEGKFSLCGLIPKLSKDMMNISHYADNGKEWQKLDNICEHKKNQDQQMKYTSAMIMITDRHFNNNLYFFLYSLLLLLY